MHTTAPSPTVGSSEATRMLRVSRSTVARMVRDGILTPIDVPAHGYVFHREDIEKVAEARRVLRLGPDAA